VWLIPAASIPKTSYTALLFLPDLHFLNLFKGRIQMVILLG
jgi:hypothetical protein